MTEVILSGATSSDPDRTVMEASTQSPMPSSGLDRCDIIAVIPRPEFPIKFHEGAPPPFSQETQNRSKQWGHDHYLFTPYPERLTELNDQRIRDTLQPHLNRLGYDSKSAEIEFLSEGGFHRVYTITAQNQETKQTKSFVLRIP